MVAHCQALSRRLQPWQRQAPPRCSHWVAFASDNAIHAVGVRGWLAGRSSVGRQMGWHNGIHEVHANGRTLRLANPALTGLGQTTNVRRLAMAWRDVGRLFAYPSGYSWGIGKAAGVWRRWVWGLAGWAGRSRQRCMPHARQVHVHSHRSGEIINYGQSLRWKPAETGIKRR